ncbi:MAG TPA: hypothetical protein VLZ83_16540 [Edaphocola sp.]|nr:hypothetical protein [Edaphocola sp.]
MKKYLKERRKEAVRIEKHLKRVIKDKVNNDNFIIFEELQQLHATFTVIIVVDEMLEELEQKGSKR